MDGDMTFGALAPASRRRVLDTLRAAGGPRDAVSLAHATGLHPNTVRFHLRLLIEAGYVIESRQAQGGRGRPQAVYACVTPTSPDGGYAMLAEVLAGTLDDAAGAELARAAGARWQRAAAGSAGAVPGAPGSLDEAATRATALFAQLGFDPVRTPEHDASSDAGGGSAGHDAARIELRACPFLDVARRHPGVVCGVHLGLLRGLVEGGPAADVPSGGRAAAGVPEGGQAAEDVAGGGQATAGVAGGGRVTGDVAGGGRVVAGGVARAFAAELVPFARPGVCVAEIRQIVAGRGEA